MPYSKLGGTKVACRVEFGYIRIRLLADKWLNCYDKRPKMVGKEHIRAHSMQLGGKVVIIKRN
jgi:hypothetical protein